MMSCSRSKTRKMSTTKIVERIWRTTLCRLFLGYPSALNRLHYYWDTQRDVKCSVLLSATGNAVGPLQINWLFLAEFILSTLSVFATVDNEYTYSCLWILLSASPAPQQECMLSILPSHHLTITNFNINDHPQDCSPSDSHSCPSTHDPPGLQQPHREYWSGPVPTSSSLP